MLGDVIIALSQGNFLGGLTAFMVYGLNRTILPPRIFRFR